MGSDIIVAIFAARQRQLEAARTAREASQRRTARHTANERELRDLKRALVAADALLHDAEAAALLRDDTATRRAMYAEFFLAKDWRLHCYGLGATALLIQLANAYLAVQINAWIARLYDTLQLCVTAPEQAAPQLAPLGWEFVVFSLPWATLAPASQYVMKRWALAWREALTQDV